MKAMRLGVLVLLTVAATFALHELAHGLTGAALGYEMFVRANSSGLAGGGAYDSDLHRDLVAAAGPVVTLFQGLVAALWIRTRPGLIALGVVLSALFMRILAAFASLGNPNDEARLGLSWGVGPWAIHVLVILILLGLTAWSVRRVRPRLAPLIGLLVLIQIGVAAVVLGERMLPTVYL